ncbi:exosortase C-terminal domain/associated protein EpsI [Desulfobacula sp.]|uniref:exosortase C-terminal domain/associated protein EpsI n=1 Tax=Desulfobacula sp. TaxID=2593537 RepID=UPI002623C99B|nr:exosortase C-terminal domain/associated protein EpsI [Desulfobacula sp.]
MTYKRTIIIITIMLVTAVLTIFASQSERISPNKPFSEFPLEIGQWEGKKGELDQEVYNILGVEDYILANYRKVSGETVNLYVGFYQSQKEGDIIHSPKNCMPGAGWKITDTSIETVKVADAQKNIRVINLLLQKGAEKQVVLYWFQSRGRIISSEYMQKIWLVIDSITKHRTDGSFVRLISPVMVDEETTINILKDFANAVYPVLNEHIPS